MVDQAPLSVGDSKYKVGDKVQVKTPNGNEYSGRITLVQVVKDLKRPGHWKHRYALVTSRGTGAAVDDSVITGYVENGGKRKGKTHKRRRTTRRTRRTFSR